MELTIEVHREEHSYSAQIVGTDVWALQGRWTSARALSELADYLEDAIQLCLDDESARLIAPPLSVGTVLVSVVTAGGSPPSASE